MRYQLLVGGTAATLLSFASPALAEVSSIPPATHAEYRIPATQAEYRVPAREYRIAQAATRSAAWKWEASFLALSAIDAAQTIDCLNRDLCEEGNPIFSKHPSTAKLIAGKLLLGGAQFALFKHALDRNPKTALRLAQMGVVVQGGVVLWNARITFK